MSRGVSQQNHVFTRKLPKLMKYWIPHFRIAYLDFSSHSTSIFDAFTDLPFIGKKKRREGNLGVSNHQWLFEDSELPKIKDKTHKNRIEFWHFTDYRLSVLQCTQMKSHEILLNTHFSQQFSTWYTCFCSILLRNVHLEIRPWTSRKIYFIDDMAKFHRGDPFKFIFRYLINQTDYRKSFAAIKNFTPIWISLSKNS